MSKLEEEWRPVKDYEGFYEVSDWGRVRSVDREIEYIHGKSKKITKQKIKGKILSPSKDGGGYLIVNLCKNGVFFHKKIHRLVAEAFIPNPDNKPSIDHINTIRYDNMVDNLRWVTQKENCNNDLTRNNPCRFYLKQFSRL